MLAGIRDAEGMAQSTFRLVGPLNQSGGITFAGGEITARQVSFTHVNVPERVTGMQGRFVLADGSTQFDQITGHLGGPLSKSKARSPAERPANFKTLSFAHAVMRHR